MAFGCCTAPDVADVARPRPRRTRRASLAQSLKRAGSWVFEEQLGGGNSEVFAARHSETGAPVAVKVCERGGAACSEFKGEAAVLSYVMKHASTEHIVCLHDTMRGAKGTYLVLERVAGSDLTKHLESSGALNESTARWVFEGVASAMMELQRVGVAHRDIKPDNIVADLEGRQVKLVDFGLAHLHAGAELCSDTVGTPPYLAPEVQTGCYDAYKSDVFSLGMALYVTCTGRFPRRTSITAGLDSPGFRSLSAPLQYLITNLTAFDPAARPHLVDVLAHPWFNMSTTSPATTSLSSEGAKGMLL